MTFDLHGYSERGMIWTLFGEIAGREDASALVAGLLNLISRKDMVTTVTILIEQSFSDFGDADVLLLLDGPERSSVFIEAKVSCGKTWTLHKELACFKRGSDSAKKAFSNLFCQLYAKQRLIEVLRSGSIPVEGAEFLEGFRRRKLGRNEVVHRAVDLLRPYTRRATYVALVPDASGFDVALREFTLFTGRECADWGVLAWAQLERFCQEHSLKRTLRAFSYNRSQIY